MCHQSPRTTGVMGSVHHQLRLREAKEMAAIIANDSSGPRGNGRLSGLQVQDCSEGIRLKDSERLKLNQGQERPPRSRWNVF